MTIHPTDPPASICLLRLSAIGDCCHTLAVVRTLRQHLPKTRISWVIGKTEAALMAGLEDVELIVFDKRGGRAEFAKLRKTLAGRQFDVLLNMHASWRANWVSRLITAKRRIGFDRERARDFQWLFCNERIQPQYQPHVIDGLFGFAKALGINERNLIWDIPLPAQAQDFARSFVTAGKPLLIISPCSSQRARNYRNWPAENYAAAAQYATDAYGANILLTGGNSELEVDYAEQIMSAGPPGIRNLVGKTSLKQLHALIAEADVVICPDSGPAHMATAAGSRVIGLYASSNPGRTGPVLSRELVVNRYPDALRNFDEKDIEQVRWGQRVRHPQAMTLISLADVTAKIDLVLGSKQT